MADFEGRTEFPAKRRRPVVPMVTLLIGILLGFLIPHPSVWQRATTHSVASVGPALPFVLGEWEYPGAKSLSRLEGGSSKATQAGVTRTVACAPGLYAYSTPDAFETVWGHYAKLSGIGEEFRPGTASGKTDFAATLSSGGGAGAMGGRLYYTGDPSRLSVRSATIVAQRPGYTVTVFITKSKDEDQTHVSMVVEEKPALPAP